MIIVDGVHRSFGARVLLQDASLRVGARDRVALVGPNGSGKTTLLEMIVGAQAPDAGRIDRAGDVAVGYLAQETDSLRGRDILNEVMSAAPAMSQAGHRLEVLEREMTETDDADERARLLFEFTRLQGHFEDLGGYAVETEARRILSGLGFSNADLARPTDSRSGGWLMRVALAKLLLAGPDALLLDEPTNHLDLESMRWLERFLRSYEGAILLVSHDRDFMNALATKVTEIRDAKLVTYTGDYEAFVRQRELEAEQMAAAARNQAKKIAHTEAFINRFRYKASKARQVQSRIKMLDKVERIDAPKRGRRAMKVGFPQPPRSGQVVIELSKMDFAYGDTSVYRSLDVVVERGEKVALVGPNGAGKTTLLKLLAGVLTPNAGERRLGHNVALGYFAQHQIEALDPANRVMEELERAIPPGVTIRPRDLLGRFLFSGDDVDKPVSVLSGGERTRLALAKLLVTPVNFMCLDEPTNHLDITSRDVLEDALVEYGGTIVLITHDRHLIRSVANRIIEVTSGVPRSYEGAYDDYLYRKAQESEEQSALPAKSAGPQKDRGKLDKAEARRQRAAVRRVENELESAHAERERLEQQLADPLVYVSSSKAEEAMRAQSAAARRVSELESEWERLTDGLEGAG
ncbi:MAG: ABC-F family ATP-binding cassette domain-containing protein [Actinomycetota bacterium]